MPEYVSLNQFLSQLEHRRFLVLDSDSLPALKNRDGIENLPEEADVLIIVDLANALSKFIRLLGGRERLTTLEMQTVAGVGYRQLQRWTKSGVVASPIYTTSVGNTWHPLDGFLIGVAASLRLAGQPLTAIKIAISVVREEATELTPV